MKQGAHLSMIRGFHLADWLTLGNASGGVGALFAVMTYLLNAVAPVSTRSRSQLRAT